MFVERNPDMQQTDDFNANVAPLLGVFTEAVPVHEEGFLMGWKIQGRFE